MDLALARPWPWPWALALGGPWGALGGPWPWALALWLYCGPIGTPGTLGLYDASTKTIILDLLGGHRAQGPVPGSPYTHSL